MDIIRIDGMEASAIIGTLPEERGKKQALAIDIELGCDLSKAGRSDSLSDTVDYQAVEGAVHKLVEDSSFMLLEALAEAISKLCLSFEGVQTVKVRIAKPYALQRSSCVHVEIFRKQDGRDLGL